jgi:hypothetical protein
VHLRLETDGAGIGEIVRHAGLLQKSMLGAGHGGVDQPVHLPFSVPFVLAFFRLSAD